MDLAFRRELAQDYRSASQRARILSEDWVHRALPCPSCGHKALTRQANNSRVSDFSCRSCGEHFEVKASARPLGRKIPDGAYGTMLERLNSDTNPSLLHLHYDPEACKLRSLSLIPRQFLTAASIERRRPLGPLARRAGWVGCNILLATIPAVGLISIIDNGMPKDQAAVTGRWKETLFLRETGRANARQWAIETMSCIEQLEGRFTLDDIYGFQPRLQKLFPNNRHIRAKLRQQLQVLRDGGFLAFLGTGSYQRLR